jgi:hypothetical protein
MAIEPEPARGMDGYKIFLFSWDNGSFFLAILALLNIPVFQPIAGTWTALSEGTPIVKPVLWVEEEQSCRRNVNLQFYDQ